MLKEVDRTFLKEAFYLQFWEKPITSIALYNAGEDPSSISNHLSNTLFRPSMDMSGHIQRIITARLIAELVNSLENFGSFCYAVKNRHKKSIFSHYALNKLKHNDFFNEIKTHSDSLIDLSTMIGIPTLMELENKMTAEAYLHVSKLYSELAKLINQATTLYKANWSKDESSSPYEFYVAYHITDREFSYPSNQDDLVKMYNKIKHRFLLFSTKEEVINFKKVVEKENINGLNVQFVPLLITQEFVDSILTTINNIAFCMRAIASILIYLDSNQIDL
ncbi:Hypothetical protein LUCI_0792 [Lucifera butyrica]|uniref:Uncharacterized protein n=1 Tax=Lucifera butyrica TaxID=1351585 RepID=A0A498R5R8_9FIRM|nr:hypothetical protein [Lucifera butyrica]VBB05582.1 Hypothetical protein LUCI_0792 [Lucifera butyrica]